MSDRNKKKNSTKNTYLSIRLNRETKKMIEQRAEKSGKTTSAYVLDCILSGENKEGDKERMAEMSVICQYLCNHMEEKYSDDEIVEEGVERLWEILL